MRSWLHTVYTYLRRLTGYVAYYGLKPHLPALSGTRSEKRETGGRKGRERRESAREGGKEAGRFWARTSTVMSFSILALHKSFASNVHEQLLLSSFRPLDAPPPFFFPRRLQPPFGPEKPASQPASPQRKRVGSGAWGFSWRLSSQAKTMFYWRGCRVAPIFFWVVTLRYFQDEGDVRGVFAELEERSLVRRKVTVSFFGAFFGVFRYTKERCSIHSSYWQRKGLWAPYGLLLTWNASSAKTRSLKPTSAFLLVSLLLCT